MHKQVDISVQKLLVGKRFQTAKTLLKDVYSETVQKSQRLDLDVLVL